MRRVRTVGVGFGPRKSARVQLCATAPLHTIAAGYATAGPQPEENAKGGKSFCEGGREIFQMKLVYGKRTTSTLLRCLHFHHAFFYQFQKGRVAKYSTLQSIRKV